jgi:hypothetical protein
VTLSRVLHGHARVSPNLAVLEQAGMDTALLGSRCTLAMSLAADRAAIILVGGSYTRWSSPRRGFSAA